MAMGWSHASGLSAFACMLQNVNIESLYKFDILKYCDMYEICYAKKPKRKIFWDCPFIISNLLILHSLFVAHAHNILLASLSNFPPFCPPNEFYSLIFLSIFSSYSPLSDLFFLLFFFFYFMLPSSFYYMFFLLCLPSFLYCHLSFWSLISILFLYSSLLLPSLLLSSILRTPSFLLSSILLVSHFHSFFNLLSPYSFLLPFSCTLSLCYLTSILL